MTGGDPHGDEGSDLRQRAQRCFARDDFRGCREAALRVLEQAGDDIECLRLAGRCGLELGADDAVAQLRRVTELVPADVQAWRDLGDALATEGRMREASQAWGSAIELRPRDSLVLTSLAHAALVGGSEDEATARLQEAAEIEPRNRTAALSLVDVHRGAGRLDDALDVAKRAWGAAPGDVLAGLDVAELCAQLGRFDEAEAAWRRLRAIDDEDSHQIYALYGLARVAIARGDWTVATDVAVEAARVDASLRTADLLAFVAERTFGSLDRTATSPVVGALLAAGESGVFALPLGATTDRRAPNQDQIEYALDLAQAEHRRLHLEPQADDESGG